MIMRSSGRVLSALLGLLVPVAFLTAPAFAATYRFAVTIEPTIYPLQMHINRLECMHFLHIRLEPPVGLSTFHVETDETGNCGTSHLPSKFAVDVRGSKSQTARIVFTKSWSGPWRYEIEDMKGCHLMAGVDAEGQPTLRIM